MTTAVQRRRGTNTEHATFTGLDGEITVNTTTYTLHVHDGATVGGVALAKADGSNLVTSSIDINGGTIDGTVIGGSSAAAGTFTSITGTSANINGTVTADGLSVDSGATNTAATFTSTDQYSFVNFKDNTSTDGTFIGVEGNNFIVQSDSSKRLLTAAVGGGISFYKSDGSTTGVLWDASASTLDVAGTVTADGLTVDSSGTAALFTNGDGLTQLGKIVSDATYGFVLEGKVNSNLTLKTKANGAGEGTYFLDTANNKRMFIEGTTGDISFYEDTGTTAKFFWDASAESLLIGKTSSSFSTVGVEATGTGKIRATMASDNPISLNRTTTDGDIAIFAKDGATVGSIRSKFGDIVVGNSGTVGIRFDEGVGLIPWDMTADAAEDAQHDIGAPSVRYKDLYLSGGVYLGGTGAANHLDDYETGTFTPTVYSSDNTTVLTSGVDYALNDYRYVKTGNHVMMEVRIQDLRTIKTDIWCTLPFTSLTSDSGVGITAEGDVIYLASNRLNFRKGTNQYPYGVVNYEAS